MPLYPFMCDEPEGCGHETTFLCSFDDLPAEPVCEKCGKPVRRVYGIGMARISYSQNGREAVAVNLGGGKNIYRSKTRENYMNGKGTQSVYTKEYQGRLDKAAAEKAARMKAAQKRGKS